MTREEEITAIEMHVARHGVYLASMGESHYGDENVPIRERIAAQMRNRKIPKPRPVLFCQHCGDVIKGNGEKYCRRKCYFAAHAPKTVDCSACGKKLKRRLWMTRIYKRHFCNSVCQNVWRWGPGRDAARSIRPTGMDYEASV